MHHLMRLPELFAALRVATSLLAAVLLQRGVSVWTGILLGLTALLGLAGYVIGVRCDMLSRRGVRLCFGADVCLLLILLAAFTGCGIS